MLKKEMKNTKNKDLFIIQAMNNKGAANILITCLDSVSNVISVPTKTL